MEVIRGRSKKYKKSRATKFRLSSLSKSEAAHPLRSALLRIAADGSIQYPVGTIRGERGCSLIAVPVAIASDVMQ